MKRLPVSSRLLAGLAAAILTAQANHFTVTCGTSAESTQQSLFFHRLAQKARQARLRPFDATPPSVNRDIGDIAIIEDSGGVVERQNQFNLDNNSVAFNPATPATASYRYTVSNSLYDDAVAASGSPLVALGDDDTRSIALPFAFPFYGVSYRQLFVNSDGNLTFGAPEFASTERSLGRLTAGPPRIAPLFTDLDPSQTAGGVRVFATAARVVVSWINVPEFTSNNGGARATFQVALYSDGRIQFSYNGVGLNLASAVVGIAPGNLDNGVSLVDFRSDPSGVYSGAIAERFGNNLAIDMVTAAQQFYRTHEDSYDYLVIYNNMNIQAMAGALAYENTVRNRGVGFNVPVADTGAEYGSPSRLQAVLNLGQLSQYPLDPNAAVPARAQAGDTPLTIIGHEAGHRFLAFVSIADPNIPTSTPMLGFQKAHWNFAYDSEASLLEGERIADRAPTTPRFLTTDITQGYSPLDQYLMGFRPPSQVPDTFAVTHVTIAGTPVNTDQLHQIADVAFDGTRLNVNIDALVQKYGRRTPDDTMAQRRFRFGFILIVPQGSQPSAADIEQVDAYRRQFESFFVKSSSGNAIADTSLRRGVKLSLSPAAGVVAGSGPAPANIALQTAPDADLVIHLQAPLGYAAFPAVVIIPAGATGASFTYTPLKPGVEELLAVPDDAKYETVAARVQVAAASILTLQPVSGDQQAPLGPGALPNPIVVRLTDVNDLPYAGARVLATPSTDGVAVPAEARTDANGFASFTWTPGPSSANQLTLSVEGAPSVQLSFRAGTAVPAISAVTNAASFAPGLTPGGLGTVFGQNLDGGVPQVTVNGVDAPVLFFNRTQINFYVPPTVAVGTAVVGVTVAGAGASTHTSVLAAQPGIFFPAILRAGSGLSAVTNPVRAGDYLEIYCTGLGSPAVQPSVFIGATPVQPVNSGPLSGVVGVYQVNIQVPAGIPAGSQPVMLELNQQLSNAVNILVQ